MTGVATEPSAGSALVEALVGIGMLMVITSSLHTFGLARLAAEEASEIRIIALGLAQEHLEGEVLAAGPMRTTRTSSGPLVMTSTLDAWTEEVSSDRPCGASGPVRVGGPVVAVTRDGEQGDVESAPVLRLFGTRIEELRQREVAVAESVKGSSIRVDGTAHAWSDVVGEHFEVRPLGGGSGEVMLVTADVGGCLHLPPLTPGRYVVRPSPTTEGGLIDTSHRTGSALRLDLSVLDRPVTVSWQLAQPVQVTVKMVAPGARPPDLTNTGPLQWMVRGDEGRARTELGVARPLHPGPAVIVISPCHNPEAFGSSVSVQIPHTGPHEVDVPLATVTLDGLAGRTDHAITAERTTGCGDASTTLARVRWERGLHDGMRIALPHGEWRVTLETLQGADPTDPIIIHAGEPDAAGSFP